MNRIEKYLDLMLLVLMADGIVHDKEKALLDAMISNASNNVTNINKQDDQLIDNVETVNGYVAIEWVSLWEMARIFSPIHPTLVIIILVGMLDYSPSNKATTKQEWVNEKN